MNQVEKNSIGGYAFTLETTAAEKIDKYLGELKEFYSGIESGNEIMEGIEERMAELLVEKCGENGIVTESIANTVINVLGKPEEIESESAEEKKNARKEEPVSRKKKIYRDLEGGKILGVCSGLAAYFNMDVVAVRTLFVVFTVVLWMAHIRCFPTSEFTLPLVIYLLAGFIIPPARTVGEKHRMKGEGNTVQDIQKTVQESIDKASGTIRDMGNSEAARSAGNLITKTMGVLMLLIGFAGLFAGSLALFWSNVFGISTLTGPVMAEFMGSLPGVYAAYDTIWVKGLIIAAAALPFVWFIYTGLLCLIEFKAPKWHPGLVIFIVWLLTLIMLSVTGFMGCLPILLNS